jgi:hypothetical protein
LLLDNPYFLISAEMKKQQQWRKGQRENERTTDVTQKKIPRGQTDRLFVSPPF